MDKALITGNDKILFCFGIGYTARTLGRLLRDEGWTIIGTYRRDDDISKLSAEGWRLIPFDEAAIELASATHVLSSVPPNPNGDPVIEQYGQSFSSAAWIGYLSTTGVYGDTGGAMVAEDAPLAPTNDRSRWRLAAEDQWRAIANVHIFRLAGIYGPGRSILDRVRAGTAQRIHKPGHLFSRIHVADVAAVLQASMAAPDPGAIYNVCDDTPAPQAELVAYACELLGVEPPPLVDFEFAKQSMSPMALSFWNDNRRLDNSKMKRELGVTLRYADYKTGLKL